jgi:two-component system response regulator FlrC
MRRGSVLVVEDDTSLRLLCRVNLELEQFRVREAATVEEARAAVAEERPAIVFLDVHLQGEASELLLAELRDAGVPVVIVTGSAAVDHYREQADAVLAKPFEPAALIAAARQYVG